MAKIGLIQVDNKMSGDIKDRQDYLIELAKKCLDQGTDLVFFPEMFQYVKHRNITNEREKLKDISDKWMERCSEIAHKYHAYVVPWDYYVSESGDIFNSSYILDRNGDFVGRYSKCNLTSNEMKRGLTHGTDFPVFDLDIGRVGIIICFDNYFPESAASLGNKGAELILYPLYGDTLKPQWEMKLRTRAIDHSVYMASCQLDPYWDIAYTGIVDPEGNVIAKIDEINTYKVIDIDMGKTIWSDTSANHPYGEDLREYLHKCRNYKAFKSLADEGSAPFNWEDIFYKE